MTKICAMQFLYCSVMALCLTALQAEGKVDTSQTTEMRRIRSGKEKSLSSNFAEDVFSDGTLSNYSISTSSAALNLLQQHSVTQDLENTRSDDNAMRSHAELKHSVVKDEKAHIIPAASGESEGIDAAELHVQSNEKKPLTTTITANSRGNPKQVIQSYKLWSGYEIKERLYKWADHYPDFVSLTTAQEAYGLPPVGTKEDCPFEDGDDNGFGDGCLHYIVTIQDYVKHPVGSASSARLPEVFWSGLVHGNEVVGPTAVLEAAQLLLDAVQCVSYPRYEYTTSADATQSQSREYAKNDVAKAETCRRELMQFGISERQMQWLARLVSTRRLVIVPTSNVLGYMQNERTENGLDINRDFPYDLEDATQCMQTIGGRVLDQVFRQYMFQLSLTFHGGMAEIGYEWGAPTWLGYRSPDDVGQMRIAQAYSQYASSFDKVSSYKYGPMNDAVYPVRGGMEDWAYAGSWDTERVITCEPTQYGGYAQGREPYDAGTLRVLNMLIETSDDKRPSDDTLGTSEKVLESTSVGSGHVTRNIRLSLMSLELVEPYVRYVRVNEYELSEDVVPTVRYDDDTTADALSSLSRCKADHTVVVPDKNQRVVIEWSVGGALQIDETRMWYARRSDIPDGMLSCGKQAEYERVVEYMRHGVAMTATSGEAGYASASSVDTSMFAASFDMIDADTGDSSSSSSSRTAARDEWVVIVSARVDQQWAATEGVSGSNEQPIGPSVLPQSHMVNVRTNADWRYEKEGHVVEGRVEWFSMPMTIVKGPKSSEKGDAEVLITELHTRPNTVITDGPEIPLTAEELSKAYTSKSDEAKGFEAVSGIIIVVVGVGVLTLAGFLIMKYQMRRARRDRVREFIEDENAISPGLREKDQNGQYADDPMTSGYSEGDLELT